MSHYCGIDLHSNNHVVVVIDDEDKRVFDKRLSNDLSMTLEVLSPYRETLKGIAVESTFNWYWLVDGLQEDGFGVQLVNTAAVKQYDGLKCSGDHISIALPVRATLLRIAALLTPRAPATVKRKVQVMPRPAINTFPGLTLRRRILRFAMSRWHNAFMNERRPKRMALSRFGRWPGNWPEPPG
jgi:hypothetical protein